MINGSAARPARSEAPTSWQFQCAGDLRAAVLGYMTGGELTVRQVKLIAAYLRYWIDSPVWDKDPNLDYERRLALGAMRERAAQILTESDITECVLMMVNAGMDPL